MLSNDFGFIRRSAVEPNEPKIAGFSWGMPYNPKTGESEHNKEHRYRNTRRKFTAENKIRIAVKGLRGEIPISELPRREGVSPSQYYKWSKQFLEGGKAALIREPPPRNAADDEVWGLRDENERLKIALAKAHIDVIKYRKSIGLRWVEGGISE